MVARTKTSKKRKAKEEKDTKKKKKKKHQEETTEDDGNGPAVNEEQHTNEDTSSSANDPDKNKAVKGNPQGVTRLFLGNLPFAVDEASLESFLPKSVTHIKWITDKETGKFYGSGFIEMNNSLAAADAVAMAGSPFMGRRKLLMCCGCALH
jgi:nucleolin